jgi:heterodisulfide reductase subunit A
MNQNGQPRIGVFICHCGTNIAGRVNVSEVVAFASQLDNVIVAREYKFMCSDPGQELIRQAIREHNLNRVVVASCSPLMHEPTFRGVTAEGGLNPFFFQMANIREQVSWVTEDPEKATKKAKAMVSAAVRRVALHDPLLKKEVPVRPEVLIVGGGIAGIHAALTYANSGKKVYLVEKEPSIGGHMSHLDKTFPTLDCAACILTPKMSEVGKNPNIVLMTWSEVEEVSGFVGNFKVKIKKKARYVDLSKCNGCGACWENCPTTITPSERIIRKGDIIIKTVEKEA